MVVGYPGSSGSSFGLVGVGEPGVKGSSPVILDLLLDQLRHVH